MIKIENFEVVGWEHVIRGMRNPMNSWEKGDSRYCDFQCEECFYESACTTSNYHPTESYRQIMLGPNDHELMMKLRNAGTDHRKFMRMITVYLDIIAPLYWWKEFDTYKVGTVANSCSTMHKIHEKEFTLEDFSHEHLFLANSSGQFTLTDTDIKVGGVSLLNLTINVLNGYRTAYSEEADTDIKKLHWWQMIQLLPSSYNQKRTVMLNYEVLANLYKSRKDHKLDEWRDLCGWIEGLPYSELITGKVAENGEKTGDFRQKFYCEEVK